MNTPQHFPPAQVYSTNEHDFSKHCDSLRELILLNQHLRPKDTVWIADLVCPEPAEIIQAPDIIDLLHGKAKELAVQRAMPESASGDWPLFDMDNESETALQALLDAWIEEWCPVWFNLPVNIRPYTLSRADFSDEFWNEIVLCEVSA